MKRLNFILLAFVFFLPKMFSNDFFKDRFFEIDIDLPLHFSNNALQLTDIFQEEVVIDLRKMCDDMGEKGFMLNSQVSPIVSLKLDIPKGLILDLSLGLDAFGNMNISKDLFEFLGYGLELNENLDIGLNGKVDVFAFTSLSLGWNLEKGFVKITPAAFSSVIHAYINDSHVSVINKEDGSFGYLINGNISLFTGLPLPVNESGLSFKDFQFSELTKLFEGIGFDISACVGYEYSDNISFMSSVRIPIIPSRISNESTISFKSEFETNLSGMTGEEMPKPTVEKELKTNVSNKNVKVNRPFDMAIDFDFHPFGSLLKYYGGIGLSVDNPFFAEEMQRNVYFNYLIGTRFSIVNIFSLSASMGKSYGVYINRLDLGFSLRFAEINAGLAFQGTSLSQSFKGAGLGVYINTSVGF